MCAPAGVEHLCQILYLMIHRPQRGRTLVQKSPPHESPTPTGSNIGTKISTSRITDPNGVKHWYKNLHLTNHRPQRGQTLVKKSPPHESPTPTGSNIGTKISTSRITDPNGVAHWSKNLHPTTYRPQRGRTLVQKTYTLRYTDPIEVTHWHKNLHLTNHRPQRGHTLAQKSPPHESPTPTGSHIGPKS
jgi:hypothetical protein